MKTKFSMGRTGVAVPYLDREDALLRACWEQCLRKVTEWSGAPEEKALRATAVAILLSEDILTVPKIF